MAQLIVQIEGETPVVHELTDGAITIGREMENTIVIADASVSRRHAEIPASDGPRTLRDLDSANGTAVNWTPITEKLLKPGDVIHFGVVRATFVIKAKAAAPAPDFPARPTEPIAQPLTLVPVPVEPTPVAVELPPPPPPPVAVETPAILVEPPPPPAVVVETPVPLLEVVETMPPPPVAVAKPPAPIERQSPPAEPARDNSPALAVPPSLAVKISPPVVAKAPPFPPPTPPFAAKVPLPAAKVPPPVEKAAPPVAKLPEPPALAAPPPVVTKLPVPVVPAAPPIVAKAPIPAKTPAPAAVPPPAVAKSPLPLPAAPAPAPPVLIPPPAVLKATPVPAVKPPVPAAVEPPTPAAAKLPEAVNILPPAEAKPPAAVQAPKPIAIKPPEAVQIPPPAAAKSPAPAVVQAPPPAAAVPVPSPAAAKPSPASVQALLPPTVKPPAPAAPKPTLPAPASRHWRPEPAAKERSPKPDTTKGPPSSIVAADDLPLVPVDLGQKLPPSSTSGQPVPAFIGVRERQYAPDGSPSFFARHRVLVAALALALIAAAATGAFLLNRPVPPPQVAATAAPKSPVAAAVESTPVASKRFWDQMQGSAHEGLKQAQSIPFKQYPVMSSGMYDFQLIDDNSLDALMASLTARSRGLARIADEISLLDRTNVDPELVAFSKKLGAHWQRASSLDSDAVNVVWAVHERRARPAATPTPALESADVVPTESHAPGATPVTMDQVSQLANSWLMQRNYFVQVGLEVDASEKAMHLQLAERYKDQFK